MYWGSSDSGSTIQTDHVKQYVGRIDKQWRLLNYCVQHEDSVSVKRLNRGLFEIHSGFLQDGMGKKKQWDRQIDTQNNAENKTEKKKIILRIRGREENIEEEKRRQERREERGSKEERREERRRYC